jgi:hypothetical protein
MAEGAWVVLGTAIGTVGSILTTWLAAHLNKPKPDPWDAVASNLLKQALNAQRWTPICLTYRAIFSRFF